MILKKWNKIPKNFSSIKLNIKLLEDKYGIYNERKKIELTINEIKKNKYIDGIIFSNDNRRDLLEFLKIFRKKVDHKLKMPKLNNSLKKELDPRKWKKIK